MFEQTLLAAPNGARKKTALFASFTAQILICGVLFLIPLLYTDVLPVFRGFDKLLPPVAVSDPPPPPEAIARPASRTRTQFRAPVLVAPRQIPETVAVIDESAAVPRFYDVPVATPGLYEAGLVRSIDLETPAPPKPVAAPKAEAPPPPADPVAVSSTIQAAKLIKRVIPPYPLLARQTRTAGTVKLLAIIGKDGMVRRLDVIEGHPLLRQAALDAVRQWVYSPTIVSGQAVEVQAEIDVNFTLNSR